MEPTPENIKAFKHARWRVRFTAHLIALHEGMSDRESSDWGEERAEYVNRHLLAKEDFGVFPKDWGKKYP